MCLSKRLNYFDSVICLDFVEMQPSYSSPNCIYDEDDIRIRKRGVCEFSDFIGPSTGGRATPILIRPCINSQMALKKRHGHSRCCEYHNVHNCEFLTQI